MKLPTVFTPIATSTDHGQTWTSLPRALFSVEAANELQVLGHAQVQITPNGLGRFVMSVRAKRA